MVIHQTIGERDTVLTAEDLAALREDLHEQRLFRQEQLRQSATRSSDRADDRRREAGAARIEVGVELAAFARMVLADWDTAWAETAPRWTTPT